jgi:hypothetical protein
MQTLITKIQAGKHELHVEKVGKRYVIRLVNGVALSLGATAAKKDEIIQGVSSGSWDTYIENFCK